MGKKITALVFVFILLSFASGASLQEENASSDLDSTAGKARAFEVVVNDNKTDFYKGQTLDISIFNPWKDVEIDARTSDGKLVFSKKVKKDSQDELELKYAIDLVSPKGGWVLDFFDGNQTITKNITVKPTRESEFLLIEFLSPPPKQFNRTDTISIMVRVTDAGEEVNDASIYFWGLDGVRRTLHFHDKGIYKNSYTIPIDSQLGKWNLTAVAEQLRPGIDYGGEGVLALTIVQSGISIEIVKPIVKEFDFGEQFNLTAKLTYGDGSLVREVESAKLLLPTEERTREFDLNQVEPGTYSVVIQPDKLPPNVFTVSIEVKDKYGNFQKETMTFEPKNYWIYLIKKNWLLLIFPIIFIFLLGIVWAKQLRLLWAKSREEIRKRQVLALKRRLEQDYLVRGLISERVFKEKSMLYGTELKKIEDKLREIEQGKIF